MIPRKIDRRFPLPRTTVEILTALDQSARALGLDYMVVGATARDILLTHVFGLPTVRATVDVDFAVALRNWEQYAHLKEQLRATGLFEFGAEAHRLIFKGASGKGDDPLDLVPFGSIAEASNMIAWPPDMKVVMSVAGYDDAIGTAESVQISDTLRCKVVSLAGLALLKVIAWSERGRKNPKDAIDLWQVMTNYSSAGNLGRVYDDAKLLESADFDPDLAGMFLLGRDMRQAASESTRALVREIISRDFDRLSLAMLRNRAAEDGVQGRIETGLRGLARQLA